jgi:hypothetical protein
MHARIDQLLSLRDGEPVDAEVRVHVQHCTQCLGEAALLAKTRSRLQELPTFEPPADLWPRIATRAAARPPRRLSLGIAAAAAAFVVGVAVLIAIRDASHGPGVGQNRIVQKPMIEDRALPTTADSDTQKLIAQSRELDELLQYLPERPRVERVSLAATVDSIEERIQVLDWQLAYSSDADLDHRQAHRLWSERVELMDSLVKVRYAESAPMTF